MIDSKYCQERIETLSSKIGVKSACDEIGLPRSTYYFWSQPKKRSQPAKRIPNFAYSIKERETIVSVLNSEWYLDQTPYEIYSSELDNGNYWCSVRTMYRILHNHDQVQERRNQRRHITYSKPELLATHPNQVWSWDITKLKGPRKWTYFYLYVIVDIFSRLIVGWMVAFSEKAVLAKKLIADSCRKQQIQKGQLTLHADRGSSMRSKPVALLLSDLGVTKSHSRPYTSNDNPYSESHFKTMKYRPDFPGSFQSMNEAREFCKSFFDWYNSKHYHSGLEFLTPESVHYGFADTILDHRNQVLMEAFQKHPEWFRGKKPKVKKLPKAVYINKPENIDLADKK